MSENTQSAPFDESDNVASPIINEHTLLAIFDSAPDATLVSHENGTIVLANRQVERLLGYTASELIGQSVDNLVPQSARQHHRQMRQAFSEQPQFRAMENTGKPLFALCKDGSILPVDISLGLLRADLGMLVSVTIRDASVRVDMETSLRKLAATLETRVAERMHELHEQMQIRAAAERSASEAARKLKVITDGLPEIVLQFAWNDADLQLKFVSRQSEIMLGVAPEDAMNAPDRLLQTIVSEDRPAVLESIRLAAILAVQIAQSWKHEFRVYDRHGRIRWMKGEAVPQRQESGEMVWNGYWQDITEHKDSEETLRHTVQQLQVLLRTLPTAVALCDRRTRTFVSCNPAVATMFGYSHDEILGRSTRLLYSSTEEFKKFGSLAAKRFETGQIARMHVPMVRKDGKRLFALVSGGLIDSDSGIAVISFTDITTEMELTDQLEEARRQADAANQAKSAFLAAMSHEIRTPMHGMLGMLELIARGELSADQRESIALVQQSAGSLMHIVNEVLDLSKIEAGRMEIHAATMSIAAMARELAALHSAQAAAKGLQMLIRVDDHIAATHLADAGRLRQVLNNLLSNAIKFTDSGSISLRVELAENLPLAQRICFSVEDSGIGFGDEDRKRLFAPYVQLHTGASRQYGGTGLGLSICKRLVEAMGGSITAQGRPGRGTRMSFSLLLPVIAQAADGMPDQPAAPVMRTPTGAGTSAALTQPGLKILVVDDHPVNLRLITRQLQTLGYQVETAAGGVEALEKWRIGHFDLVLTDCYMPHMDGYALSRAIRHIETQRGAPAGIPIIACSANALPSEKQTASDAGMNDSLLKPVSLESLRTKLDEWLTPGRSGQARH